MNWSHLSSLVDVGSTQSNYHNLVTQSQSKSLIICCKQFQLQVFSDAIFIISIDLTKSIYLSSI